MSSISSVSSSLISQLASSSSSSTQSSRSTFLQTAAKALGMSTDDVTSALKSGSSLADLAKKQGVSESDLVSALEQNAPDDLKSSSDLEQMTTTLVEQKGLSGPDGQQGPPPPPSSSSSSSSGSDSTGVFGDSMTTSQTDTLSSLASLLGTDSSSLMSSLQSGSSLSDLLSSSNVSYSQLAGVVQQGLLIDTSL